VLNNTVSADSLPLERVSVCFKRANNLPYSEYTESCLLQIAAINETAAREVKLQHLIRRAEQATKDVRLDTASTIALLDTLKIDANELMASTAIMYQQHRMVI
jgi:hypothetical protein